MRAEFAPIRLDMKDEYMKRLAGCPQMTSDYSFANVYGWAEEYGLELSWGKNLAWIRATIPEVRYWAPVGPWHVTNWAECPYLADPITLTRVPEALALMLKEQLGDAVTMEEARGDWDYLYSVRELVELKGNRFHKKKNHFNQFKKQYDYDYSPMTVDCVEEALKMQEEWCLWRECEDSAPLIAENQAVFRVLTEWDSMPGLLGGAIRVDGKMIAYTVGEPLTPDTLVVHFEKGKPGYRGVYQAINQMFLEHSGADYFYVNREQDLDDEGLRKAKLSYNPVGFMKKYVVSIRQ